MAEHIRSMDSIDAKLSNGEFVMTAAAIDRPEAESAAEVVRRAAGLHGAIGASLETFGGRLRCERCRGGWAMEPGMAGRYTAKGWPRCCGYTMRWWTQRQIDAGEMPA